MISKIVENGMKIPVCKTEVIKNELKPMWKPVFLNIQQIGSKVSEFSSGKWYSVQFSAVMGIQCIRF